MTNSDNFQITGINVFNQSANFSGCHLDFSSQGLPSARVKFSVAPFKQIVKSFGKNHFICLTRCNDNYPEAVR